MSAAGDVDALQRCLAAEHAACYGYGVVGGRLAGIASAHDALKRAQDSYDAHRSARDALATLLDGLGADPVAAEPAYALPFTPERLAGCERLARYLENRCAESYVYGVSLSVGHTRRLLAGSLAAAAGRAASWGAAPQAFPGRPDL